MMGIFKHPFLLRIRLSSDNGGEVGRAIKLFPIRVINSGAAAALSHLHLLGLGTLLLSESNSPQAPLDRKLLLPGSKVLRGMLCHAWVSDALHLGWLQEPVEAALVHSMGQYLHHKARVWEALALPAQGVGAALVVAGAAQEGQQSVATG